jgi:Icc-related predicted phosphoesterase
VTGGPQAAARPVRIGAVGDLHVRPGDQTRLRPVYERAAAEIDLLLLAGDLTESGGLDEAAAVRDTFRDLGVPVVAILGNHDHHRDHAARITAMLADTGLIMLEADAVTVAIDGATVGVAGAKGTGGGFGAYGLHAFGEPELKLAARHVASAAAALGSAIGRISDADVRLVLTHYAPVRQTLAGEPAEIIVFLGNHLLGEAIDQVDPDDAPDGQDPDRDGPDGEVDSRRARARGRVHPADRSDRPADRPGAAAENRDDRAEAAVHLALHGHAHYGTEVGCTPGGVPVRNVARPVIRAPYAIYELPGARRLTPTPTPTVA